jgi:hypothetical protein
MKWGCPLSVFLTRFQEGLTAALRNIVLVFMPAIQKIFERLGV